MSIYSKYQLTKLFLEQAGLVNVPDEIVRNYQLQWWATPLSPIGFRLSLEGHKFLKQQIKLESYSYKIKEDNVKNLKLYLQMNKHVTCPYYLQGNNTIIFYGVQDATMMALMGGDLTQWMQNYSR